MNLILQDYLHLSNLLTPKFSEHPYTSSQKKKVNNLIMLKELATLAENKGAF